LNEAVLEDFRVASGIIYVKDTSKTNQFIQKENDHVSLFFASKKDLVFIANEIETKNDILNSKIADENKKLSSFTILQSKTTIKRLENEKSSFLSMLNSSSDIRTKLDISDRVSKIETKIDTLTLNLSVIDTASDELIYRKIEELKNQIIYNVSVDLVVLK